jgi:hypothetical protein
MADADQTPISIDTEGDLELKKLMLENHDIPAHITPAGRSVDATLWVASADVERAKALIKQMEFTGDNPGFGFWRCACGEQVEAQFDTCWKCGLGKPE